MSKQFLWSYLLFFSIQYNYCPKPTHKHFKELKLSYSEKIAFHENMKTALGITGRCSKSARKKYHTLVIEAVREPELITILSQQLEQRKAYVKQLTSDYIRERQSV